YRWRTWEYSIRKALSGSSRVKAMRWVSFLEARPARRGKGRFQQASAMPEIENRKSKFKNPLILSNPPPVQSPTRVSGGGLVRVRGRRGRAGRGTRGGEGALRGRRSGAR